MTQYDQWLREVLQRFGNGEVSLDEALQQLHDLPYEDIEFAKLDHHRSMRHGFPEVVLAQGKTADQIIQIVDRLRAKGGNVLVTRMSQEQAVSVCGKFPTAEYDSTSGVFRLWQIPPAPQGLGKVVVITAGTADIPVAEEAYLCSEILGNPTIRLYDVGVAGIHRLFDNIDIIRDASVLIVVAGMEGALPSVVGGLTDKPIIAVPTSIGYGASFNGIAALLGMLNSCASGMVVVNIDNGFGAAYAATRINRLGKERHG
ncbi:MAG TPA: nickel pincer cofactor biosynthesis protein LarB [bacterium]|nr:nickel pincer cofactor biosynthesis protein LarB [bacterium]